ncbi:MAG: hypothetical protein OHK0039_00560 [Bacteroidia bacterium]
MLTLSAHNPETHPTAQSTGLATRIFIAVLIILGLPVCTLAQQEAFDVPEQEKNRVRVFLDCGSCDMDYLRQELSYVDYVRDPKLASVHIIVTSLPTGGSSRNYVMDFVGKDGFEAMQQRLSCTIAPGTPWDEVRKEMTRTIQLGLIPYLAQTPYADLISVSVAKQGLALPLQPQEDPWHNWVFSVHGSGFFRMEAQSRAFNYRAGLNANRVTEDWRFRSNAYHHYDFRAFDDGEDIIASEVRNSGMHASQVRSLGGHWSAGLFGSLRSSTFDNMRLNVGLSPAIEYSVFPYTDVNRRELTIAYRVGYSYRSYFEQTVFGKDEESLWNHALDMTMRMIQQWGSLYAGMSGMHFFHDISKYRLNMEGRLSFRLVRGLALHVSGDMDIIRDQLSLPAGDVSVEDLLLQQRQLATGYRVSGSVGLDYTFGSIYNNIVNTRL